jgi:hypothetical protein
MSDRRKPALPPPPEAGKIVLPCYLYDFATFDGSVYGDAGGRGLLDFVDFVWCGDGPRLGRAAVANRMSALLGRALVRTIDVGCRWSWEIP